MKKKINYETIKGFDKDLKKLLKKFRTLKNDLDVAKKNAIELYHTQEIDNRSVFPIPSFCFKEVKIYKVKKFSCKSLKGKGVRSGIRVIYAFFVKKSTVVFIEIYYKKNEHTMEDRARIQKFLKKD